jgi:hypothetical protein
MIVMGMALLVAAAPLLWFDLDPRAGDKLLRMTSKSAHYSQLR